jgi:hypothetical protein
MKDFSIKMCAQCGIEIAVNGFDYCENCLYVLALWRKKLQEDDPIGFDRSDEDWYCNENEDAND